MLNSEYFNFVCSRDHEGIRYHGFETRGNPLILRSADGTPLAAVHFKPKNNSSKIVMSSIAQMEGKSASVTSFQCSFEETDTEFKPVISNLTKSPININLMRRNEDVKTKDPGPTLSYNEVNELQAYESYPIQRDQATKRTMKITRAASAGGSIQVKDWLSDKKQIDPQAKVEIFLSVVAERTSDVVKLFHSTNWNASSRVVVIRTQIPVTKGKGFHRQSAALSEDYKVEVEAGKEKLQMLSHVDSDIKSGFAGFRCRHDDRRARS